MGRRREAEEGAGPARGFLHGVTVMAVVRMLVWFSTLALLLAAPEQAVVIFAVAFSLDSLARVASGH